ncbi:MAG TPA: hypothetical protein VFS35_00700 [Terrimicrobiaceae bacterium]|nr:hypothetical protein [Terrimicrobiaceae bacterium]
MVWLVRGVSRGVRSVLGWSLACPWFVASIVLGLAIKENFPFSHWPMYSNFSPESGYVYVVNEVGEPMAAARFFETAPRLRKQFERERRRALARAKNDGQPKNVEEIEREAATHLLKRLAERLAAAEREGVLGLGLVSAELRMDDETRKITVTERTVARIEINGIPHTPSAEGNAEVDEAL